MNYSPQLLIKCIDLMLHMWIKINTYLMWYMYIFTSANYIVCIDVFKLKTWRVTKAVKLLKWKFTDQNRCNNSPKRLESNILHYNFTQSHTTLNYTTYKQNGLLIYDNNENCFRIAGVWIKFERDERGWYNLNIYRVYNYDFVNRRRQPKAYFKRILS